MSPWTHLPPLGALTVFEAAYRHANFTRAAEELHYSQATVSRRIGELERDLGVELFERRRHDVAPTAEAELLHAAVSGAFNELSATSSALRRRGEQRTSFTIFSDLSLTATFIAPLLGEFRRTHPELEISVLSSWDPIESARGQFDVGLLYGRGEPPSDLVVETIASEDVFPVCSPEFAASHAPTIETLAGLPLLHVDYGKPAWVDWRHFLGATAGANVGTSVEGLVFSAYQVCLDVAERGEGVALGWERTVQSRIESGRLVRCTDAVLRDEASIRAYRPTTASNDAVADDFVALVRTSIGR